jgi:hypothetical protein
MPPPRARPIARSVPSPGTVPAHLIPSPAADTVEILLPTSFNFLRRNTVTPATATSVPGSVTRPEPVGRSEASPKAAEVRPEVPYYSEHSI